MARLFNNLSIGSKVFVAFALIIALLIACAGLSLFSLSSFERSFAQHRQRVDEVELTRDIDYDFRDLSAKVDAYLVSGSDSALADANQRLRPLGYRAHTDGDALILRQETTL